MKKRIGYKATNNFKGETLIYEIGKIYKIDKIDLANYGFHYCKNIEGVLTWYEPNEDLKILEIEDLGSKRINDGTRICTNKIKILREVPLEEHKLFTINKNNNIIYYKTNRSDDNIKIWQKYNKNNSLVYRKKIFDFGDIEEEWRFYNKNNKLIRLKHCYWYSEDSDKNSNISISINKFKKVELKNCDTYEYFYTYDKNNRLISTIDSDGIEIDRYEYDEKSNVICKYSYVKAFDLKIKELYKYDNNNRVIFFKTDDIEYHYGYDDKGNLISYKDSDRNYYNITII